MKTKAKPLIKFNEKQIEELRQGLHAMGLWGRMDDSLIPDKKDEDGSNEETEEQYEARLIDTLCDMALDSI